MLTFAITAAALNCALIAAQPILFAVAAIALAAVVLIKRRTKNPMLDLRLFTRRSFASIVFGILTSAAVFAELSYVSLWLQSTEGLAPPPSVSP